MLLDLASDQPTLSLVDVDRFYIPDPWDEVIDEFEETPAIVNSTQKSVALSLHQLAPAPAANPATILVRDELKLNRKVDPPLFVKIQDLLAQLYWVDSICDS